MANKAYVNVTFLIALNASLSFFAAMDFFTYQPLGNWEPYNLVSASGLVTGLIGVGIFAIGAFAGRFLQINAFAMALFTTIFWTPFITTSRLILSAILGADGGNVVVAVGFEAIFFTFMVLSFAWALIEMSGSVTLGG